MLQRIQRDSGVAQEITSLHYEDHRYEELSPDHAAKLRAIMDDPELFQPAAAFEPFRPLVDELLQDRLSEEGDLLALTVLLLLLPGLEALKISSYGDGLDIVDKMVLAISQSQRTKTSNCPLQRLSHVTLEALEAGTVPVRHLLSFSVILPVRKLSGKCITANAFKWRLGDVNSSIEEIEFESSLIDAESLRDILSHLPGLRVFKYDHGPAVLHELSSFEPSEFFDVMASCLAERIRDIKFTIVQPEPLELPRLGSSFLGFNELRKLETHVEFLRDAVSEDLEDDQEKDKPLPSGFYSVDSDEEEEDRLLPLVAVLPPSLELLRLKMGSFVGEEVKALFEEFQVLKSTRLPLLRQISMTYIDIEVAMWICEVCKEMSVKVFFCA